MEKGLFAKQPTMLGKPWLTTRAYMLHIMMCSLLGYTFSHSIAAGKSSQLFSRAFFPELQLSSCLCETERWLRETAVVEGDLSSSLSSTSGGHQKQNVRNILTAVQQITSRQMSSSELPWRSMFSYDGSFSMTTVCQLISVGREKTSSDFSSKEGKIKDFIYCPQGELCFEHASAA